jgi:DNA-binding NarL/FixJ family response regulator
VTDEHIEKIRSTVEASDLPTKQKTELLDRLAKVKPALAQVAQTNHEGAQNVARLVEASTHEATRKDKQPDLVSKALHRLKRSVEQFEASHPQLVASVTEYSAMLSALGI